MKKLLGWDVSSTTIGYCLLEINDTNEIKFIECNYIKPPKAGDIFERLSKTKKEILKVIQKYKPDHIGIENIIEFMGSGSSSKSILMLAVFNRTLGLMCYDYLGHAPELFNVMSIRHGLKLTKDLPSKEQMPDLVSHHLGIVFPTILNKKGKIAPETGDMADAVAVALHHANIITGRTVVKKPKLKKKKVKVKK